MYRKREIKRMRDMKDVYTASGVVAFRIDPAAEGGDGEEVRVYI